MGSPVGWKMVCTNLARFVSTLLLRLWYVSARECDTLMTRMSVCVLLLFSTLRYLVLPAYLLRKWMFFVVFCYLHHIYNADNSKFIIHLFLFEAHAFNGAGSPVLDRCAETLDSHSIRRWPVDASLDCDLGYCVCNLFVATTPYGRWLLVSDHPWSQHTWINAHAHTATLDKYTAMGLDHMRLSAPPTHYRHTASNELYILVTSNQIANFEKHFEPIFGHLFTSRSHAYAKHFRMLEPVRLIFCSCVPFSRVVFIVRAFVHAMDIGHSRDLDGRKRNRETPKKNNNQKYNRVQSKWHADTLAEADRLRARAHTHTR